MAAARPPIRVAVLGAGSIAQVVHLPLLSRMRGVHLAAVADRDALTARTIAQRFSIPAVATNFEEEIVAPLRRFCGLTIDVTSVIAGALNPFKSAGEEVADAYRKHLGMGVSLQALPDAPRFVFNSTNYATGSSFRFSKPYAGDYRIGLIRRPQFDVATAVACSSQGPGSSQAITPWTG